MPVKKVQKTIKTKCLSLPEKSKKKSEWMCLKFIVFNYVSAQKNCSFLNIYCKVITMEKLYINTHSTGEQREWVEIQHTLFDLESWVLQKTKYINCFFLPEKRTKRRKKVKISTKLIFFQMIQCWVEIQYHAFIFTLIFYFKRNRDL